MGKTVFLSDPSEEIRKLVGVIKFWRGIFVVLFLNFTAWANISASLGGEGVTGKEDNGRYYLHSRQGYTEVSAQVFRYSKVHTALSWGGGPLCLFAILRAKEARARLKKYEVD
jgi:hypothetical protein